jgi:hypothetical protein
MCVAFLLVCLPADARSCDCMLVMFDMYDVDNDGFISKKELSLLLATAMSFVSHLQAVRARQQQTTCLLMRACALMQPSSELLTLNDMLTENAYEWYGLTRLSASA